MPEPRPFRHTYTRVMSILMIVLGVIILARTFAAGGSPVALGVLAGILFVAAGAARLYLQSRGT